jgi:hypothetical protein
VSQKVGWEMKMDASGWNGKMLVTKGKEEDKKGQKKLKEKKVKK